MIRRLIIVSVTSEERLSKQLGQAAKMVQAYFDDELTAVGSSFHTYLVLRNIEMHPGVSQRVLADRLGIEGPTLTHHLDRLVSDGLVERIRGHEDRRVCSVTLTVSALAHLRKVDKVGARLDADLRSLFSKSELTTLYGALARIVDHYEGKSR